MSWSFTLVSACKQFGSQLCAKMASLACSWIDAFQFLHHGLGVLDLLLRLVEAFAGVAVELDDRNFVLLGRPRDLVDLHVTQAAEAGGGCDWGCLLRGFGCCCCWHISLLC
jgi:hypothetical protein